MAEMKSVSDHNRIKDWIENSKKAAQQLLVKVDEISDSTFKAGKLNVFFSLLSRFSYFDYRNILLLTKQYPQATDLAGYNTWKGMVPEGNQILKTEWQGKGISILAPFTDVYEEETKLVWFTVKMYDISQTTVTNGIPVKSPYTTRKKQHIDTLLKAFRLFITNEFNVEFVFVNSDLHIQTGIPCYSKGNTLYIKPDANELEQLSYMIEFIIQKKSRIDLPDNVLIYLASSVRDCLFIIWNLPKQVSYTPPYEEITKLDLTQQKTFLNEAQQWVRVVEDLVTYEYIQILKNDENNKIFEDEFLDSLIKYT